MAYTTIDDPSAYFHIQLYTGTGSSQSITNDANAGDFKPDWIWAKNRSDSAGHIAFDSTRGVNKNLTVNSTDAEATVTTQVTAFNTDGFTMGSNNGANGSSDNLVAWQWKANGGTTTSVSASGAVNAGTHQANTTAGFSIVTYTGEDNSGDTVTHGLGAVPHVIIVKNRTTGAHWAMYHHKNTSAPETDRLLLSATNVTGDYDNYWSDTAPTSSVFTVGTNGDTGDADNYVAYCFTEIQGYSKFGSYEANGNDDGPFIYTGFKPAWILFKNIDNANNWVLHDNKRGAFNVNDEQLSPNTANEEATDSAKMDFLSNGFKIRVDSQGVNNSGHTIIYMAFAEHPFVSSKGVPVTAK
jgi:hypothetical protein